MLVHLLGYDQAAQGYQFTQIFIRRDFLKVNLINIEWVSSSIYPLCGSQKAALRTESRIVEGPGESRERLQKVDILKEKKCGQKHS